MHDYLIEIIKQKKLQVAALHTQLLDTESELSKIFDGRSVVKHKSLKKVLRRSSTVKVIAEIKRASPSKGKLAEIIDPVQLAQDYVAGGAAAISVLTDAHFAGELADLQKVSQALKNTEIAVLRKDFLIDPLQIAESILYGADVVLLIVALLDKQLSLMLQKARELNIDALVEVHTADELQLAISAGAKIIGVNNRDLRTFKTNPQVALDLLPLIPANIVKIAESGIHSPADAIKYYQAGYDAVLVGETLVRNNNPREWLLNLT